jgi:ADP-ribose pyrophosphatase YjhB (NUDIX family)
MSYSVSPHLKYFTIPFGDFADARPEFDAFGVGAYIFSGARVLLLQRALTDSMPGCWEGPGGASEPQRDETLLDGVVREVLEESGLHVTRVVELVAVDCWEHHRRSGGKMRIAKYSFIVEVHEARNSLGEQLSPLAIPVQLAETEHHAFDWATEEEVQLSVESKGRYKFPLSLIGHQGPNILRAFELRRQDGE